MHKRILIFLLIILYGCANEPQITNREKYQQDHNWCMNYSTHPKITNHNPYHTQTYRECMEWFGYKFK